MTQTVLLGDICTQITDGTHSTVKDNKYGDYYLLSAKNIKDRIVISQNERKIDKTTLDSLRKRTKTAKDDVLVTSVGTIGETAIVRDDFPNYEFQRSVLILKSNTDLVDPDYLYYYMRSLKQTLISMATGAVQKCLFIGQMKSVVIKLPDLETQKKIANILGALDEKIELNRRMNETLEQMGQALFRHYFIDNPEAEKWGRLPISELCEKVGSGGTPSTKREDFYGGDVEWYSTKELKDGFLFGSEKTITGEGLSGSAAKLFPENTVMMAIYAAPTVGRLGILTSEASFNQAACGLVAKPEIGHEFIYLYLLLSRAELNNMANGAAQQNISVGKVRDFKVMSPDEDSLSGFKEKIEPIFEQIRKNAEQIQILTTLRDTLLPRLINGKVKI